MAIYYLAVQVIGRSAGRNCVAAAAYRAGERLHDERTGLTHDYTRRREDIEKEIVAPEGAPAWVTDRERLWNAVEAAERRADSQLAREMVVALPVELDREHQRELIRRYVQEQFVHRGMVADVALHFKSGNPHAHIILTMREVGPEGFGNKVRDWNRPELLEQWREQWARHANEALERAGRVERIDHRSLEAQGRELLPQVHLGPSAAALERQGIPTDRGDHNRAVAEHNAAVIDLEKARAERVALRQEQERAERLAARLGAGWHRRSAEAMDTLELQHGSPLTRDDLLRLENETRQELSGTTGEISRIHHEGQRLALVGEYMAERDQLATRVAKLESPWSVVRRVFSRNVRTEYESAKKRLDWVTRALSQTGVKDAADLQRQRRRWEAVEAPRKPALQRQLADQDRTLHRIQSALEGFAQEWLRQVERTKEQERARQEAALRARERREEHAREQEYYRHRERTRDYDRGR